MNSKYKKTISLVMITISLLALTSFVNPVSAQLYGPKTPNCVIHIYLNPDAENQDIDAGIIDINDWPLDKEWIDKWVKRPDLTMKSFTDLVLLSC